MQRPWLAGSSNICSPILAFDGLSFGQVVEFKAGYTHFCERAAVEPFPTDLLGVSVSPVESKCTTRGRIKMYHPERV